jgi:RimJ/RimL family protein N-acetyltransferase
MWTDADVRRFLWDDVVISRERAEQVVADSIASMRERGLGIWVMQLRDSGEMIGFAGLVDFYRPPHVDLMYGLAPAHWHRGYAIEASLALLAHGFETLGLDPIYAGADPPNVASIQVMERLGMEPYGTVMLGPLATTYYVMTRDGWRRRAASEPPRAGDPSRRSE